MQEDGWKAFVRVCALVIAGSSRFRCQSRYSHSVFAVDPVPLSRRRRGRGAVFAVSYGRIVPSAAAVATSMLQTIALTGPILPLAAPVSSNRLQFQSECRLCTNKLLPQPIVGSRMVRRAYAPRKTELLGISRRVPEGRVTTARSRNGKSRWAPHSREWTAPGNGAA